jgi:dynein heavy chain 2
MWLLTLWPQVATIDVQRHMSQLLPWLQAAQPMLVVGPEGSGKSMLLRSCFERLKGISVATVHCAAQTTAKHVRQKLTQVCGMFNTSSGRVLRPKEGDRLVLYLKDINLPAPDKYDTMQLVAFLQQLITYRGFYDESLEWIGVERVQIVATMNPASTLGRHQLATRMTAIVRIYCTLLYVLMISGG